MFSSAPTYAAVVTLRLPAEEAARQLGLAASDVTALDESTCRVHLTADTLEWVTIRLILLGCPFEIQEPQELVDHLHQLTARLAAGI
jgi:predicted DNA-binding transcriptional regulator YafY